MSLRKDIKTHQRDILAWVQRLLRKATSHLQETARQRPSPQFSVEEHLKNLVTMAQNAEEQILRAVGILEEQVDAQLQKIEQMDEDDFDTIRKKRLDDLKKGHKLRKEWMELGHGEYSEVANEREFFDECKKSKNVVCHFYRDSTFRCKIVDKHFKLLAPKHLEAKFITLNVEKCPFLVERLNIRVLPTIYVAVNNKSVCHIRGFTELGNTDEFSTEMLEWRLGQTKVIHYDGEMPLNGPGGPTKNKINILKASKTIRENSDEDSDDDW